jgi:AcrR family transcriptional regulator
MSPARRTAESSAALRASLVEAAYRIVARDGPAALTMRSVAAEAGCALGLPYKVFADRAELVAEVIAAEYRRLRQVFEDVVASAGTGTVAGNLARWASCLLTSPAIALADHEGHDARLAAAVEAAAGDTGIVDALEGSMVAYLAAEKRAGRVVAGVDERAFGFLIAGAVHNLLVSGEAYPRPGANRLRAYLAAVADTISSSAEVS